MKLRKKNVFFTPIPQGTCMFMNIRTQILAHNKLVCTFVCSIADFDSFDELELLFFPYGKGLFALNLCWIFLLFYFLNRV